MPSYLNHQHSGSGGHIGNGHRYGNGDDVDPSTPPSSNLWASPAQFLSSSFEAGQGLSLASMAGHWNEEYHRQQEEGMLRDASASGAEEESSKWGVISPMTRHILRPSVVAASHGSPTIQDPRSRSLSDALLAQQQIPNISSQLYSYDDRRLSPPRRRRDSTTTSYLTDTRIVPEIPTLGEKHQPSPSALTSLSTIDTAERESSSDAHIEEYNNGEQHDETSTNETKSIPICILYGLINATIVLPVMLSFCSIIYRDDFFQQYMPVLTKLTLVSGVVHQLSFSTLSGLPFAIGQVQDAGLIFLSRMASMIVAQCRSEGLDDESILATVTVSLAIATAVLGVGLIAIGKFRLAGFVQMLPRPVIAAYLSFIGFYCGESGLLLMAGVSELTFSIFFEKFLLILPGILSGILLYFAVRRIRHVAVLPVGILMLILIFHLILLAKGESVKEATDQGWIRESDRAPIWYKTWDYIQFDKVNWSVLKHLVVTEIAMIGVVAISSSLDIAAIELELNRPLDYNGELTMVGISNVISGLTGGYTGSYIFSQTIFTMRAGIRSRLAGFVLALCELFMVVTPIPLLAGIPNFFYGALLSMICIDLCHEWLWEIRLKVTFAEYIICLSTFVLIYLSSVPIGIMGGVALFLISNHLGADLGAPRMAPTTTDALGGLEDDETTSLVPKPNNGQQFYN